MAAARGAGDRGTRAAPTPPGDQVDAGTMVGQAGHAGREPDAEVSAGTPDAEPGALANESVPSSGLDPDPEARTDPLPFRAPTDPPQDWSPPREDEIRPEG